MPVICAAIITNSPTKAICTVSKTEMLYSEFGPVSSSTVADPVSRLLKETVNHAVKPWNTPDLSMQKWKWPCTSYEMKQSRVSWPICEQWRHFHCANIQPTSRSFTCRVCMSRCMTLQGALRQSESSMRWLNFGLVKNSCCARGLSKQQSSLSFAIWRHICVKCSLFNLGCQSCSPHPPVITSAYRTDTNWHTAVPERRGWWTGVCLTCVQCHLWH